MYLMYVDECGDKGMSHDSSRYFILSGMVVHESNWLAFGKKMCEAIKKAYQDYGMDTRLELHAKAMLGRSEKEYSGIPKHSRVLLLRDVLRAEAECIDYIKIINVVVDKEGKGYGYNVFTKAWDALINRFETTIRKSNFPADVQLGKEHGILIVDETDENALRMHVRRMRWDNRIPSKIYPGETYQNNLISVIEDPMHRKSDNSIFIQLSDVNAYFLKQKIDPNTTMKKHNAQFFFEILEPVLLKEASRNDPLGIVRL